jgi:hypothetical protein
MRHFTTSILGMVLAGLGLGVAAAAKDPSVGFAGTPESFPTTVTLTRAQLPTQVSYKVKVANGATNTLNRVFYEAVVTLTRSDGTQTQQHDAVFTPTVYFESIPPSTLTCQTSGGPTPSIHCDLASLPTGSSLTFWVTVQTPSTGVSMVLTSTFGGDEGNGGGNGCCNAIAQSQTTTLVDATTDASVKKNARSFVNSRSMGDHCQGPEQLHRLHDRHDNISVYDRDR